MSDVSTTKNERNKCHEIFFRLCELPHDFDRYCINTYLKDEKYPDEKHRIYFLFNKGLPIVCNILRQRTNYIRDEQIRENLILFTFRCPDYFLNDYDLLTLNGRSKYSKVSENLKSKFKLSVNEFRNGKYMEVKTIWGKLFNPSNADKHFYILDPFQIDEKFVDMDDLEITGPILMENNTFKR